MDRDGQQAAMDSEMTGKLCAKVNLVHLELEGGENMNAKKSVAG